MTFLTRFVYFYSFVERNSHSYFFVNRQHFLIHDTLFKRKKIIFLHGFYWNLACPDWSLFEGIFSTVLDYEQSFLFSYVHHVNTKKKLWAKLILTFPRELLVWCWSAPEALKVRDSKLTHGALMAHWWHLRAPLNFFSSNFSFWLSNRLGPNGGTACSPVQCTGWFKPCLCFANMN